MPQYGTGLNDVFPLGLLFNREESRLRVAAVALLSSSRMNGPMQRLSCNRALTPHK